MLASLGAIIAAIITGILANALAQRWQQRNWFAQQRQLAHQEEFDRLQKLFDEFNSAANARLFSLRSFLRSLSSEERVIEDRKSAYYKDIANWNKILNTLYVRLTLFLSYDYTLRLENEVHERFADASRNTEALYEEAKRERQPPHGHQRENVEAKINRLQGNIANFSRDILAELINKRSDVRDGVKITYNEDNLDEFSQLTLLKFLFVSVDEAYIIRPA